MDRASIKALLISGIFGALAFFTLGAVNGGIAALLIFFACVCTAEA